MSGAFRRALAHIFWPPFAPSSIHGSLGLRRAFSGFLTEKKKCKKKKFLIVKKSGSFSIIALDACALSFCSKKLILTLNQRLELSLSEGKGEEREGLSFQGKRERRGRLEMLALDCALDLMAGNSFL